MEGTLTESAGFGNQLQTVEALRIVACQEPVSRECRENEKSVNL